MPFLWKRKKEPKPRTPLQESVDGLLASSRAHDVQKRREKLLFDSELKAVLDVINKRLNDVFLEGQARFNSCDVTITSDVTRNKKVVKEAIKILESKGWRVPQTSWSSTDGKHILSIKTGFHVSLPEREPTTLKDVGKGVLIVIAVIILLGVLQPN